MAEERVAKDSTALDEATDRVIQEMTQVELSDDAVTRVMARVRAARADASPSSSRGWLGALLEPRASWGTVAAAAALAAFIATGVTALVVGRAPRTPAPLQAAAAPSVGAVPQNAPAATPAAVSAPVAVATEATPKTGPAAARVEHPRRTRGTKGAGGDSTVTAAMVATPDEEQPRQDAAGRPGPQDVRLDVTINDQSGAGKPVAKTVSMVVADHESGSIRSQTRVPFRLPVRPADPTGPPPPEAWNTENLPLNVDAWPTILPDGRVRVKLVLSYRTASATAGASAPLAMATVEKNLIAVLTDGKPLVVSESADAATDRKVTVEVKATIQK